MRFSEQYQDDSVGGTNLGSHMTGVTQRLSGMTSGLTSNHWVLVLAALAWAILFLVPRVFKGA